jgi:hypothetical protein
VHSKQLNHQNNQPRPHGSAGGRIKPITTKNK